MSVRPSTDYGRSAQRDPFTPLSAGFRTVALGEVIAENAFNLGSFNLGSFARNGR